MEALSKSSRGFSVAEELYRIGHHALRRLIGGVVLACCVLAITPCASSAQATQPSTPVATTRPTTAPDIATLRRDPVKVITAELQSADPAVITQAVSDINTILATNAGLISDQLRGDWIKRLVALRRFDDVSQLSLRGTIIYADRVDVIDQFQQMRTMSFLWAGKPTEALAAAKQYFDVASLQDTADSILFICRCLNSVYPDDRSVLKQYRLEQIRGAKAVAPMQPPDSSNSIMDKVQIDATPYAANIRGLTGEDYHSLFVKGNLLLLAGRTDEAWDVFERAYTEASPGDLPTASESLARCMRAQDGTIGRANAWILSIRPKPKPVATVVAPTTAPSTQPMARR
jgi:hypothetical protein